jgi:hypothetical protein
MTATQLGLTTAEKIDRINALETLLAPVKPAIKELAALKVDVGNAFVGPPEAGGRMEGNLCFAMIKPRRMQRKISSMRKLWTVIGRKLFLDNCSFTLEKVEALVPSPQQAGLLVETQTGSRDVETFVKPVESAVKPAA